MLGVAVITPTAVSSYGGRHRNHAQRVYPAGWNFRRRWGSRWGGSRRLRWRCCGSVRRCRGGRVCPRWRECGRMRARRRGADAELVGAKCLAGQALQLHRASPRTAAREIHILTVAPALVLPLRAVPAVVSGIARVHLHIQGRLARIGIDPDRSAGSDSEPMPSAVRLEVDSRRVGRQGCCGSRGCARWSRRCRGLWQRASGYE